jgi:hypothetical protein
VAIDFGDARVQPRAMISIHSGPIVAGKAAEDSRTPKPGGRSHRRISSRSL